MSISNKMKSQFIVLAHLLLTGMVFITSCHPEHDNEDEIAFTLSDTMMARCEFQQAKLEKVENELRLFGKITADNNKTAQVYPIVGGVVTAINTELGDYVHQGQVLATIQSSEVAQFQKEKLDAINAVAIAEKNLQVANDLFAGKLNSEKDVTVAERELDNAKAELNRVNDIYKIYSLKSGSLYNVIAPISGFVLSKRINQNEQLPSDMSEPLFSIAEINEIWALANVNESDISKIKVGYDAEVKTLAFPDQSYKGKIDKVFNAIDPETKSMKARVKIPNNDFRLKPEMNCTVGVHFTENEDMVAVPSSSIIFDKSKYWVMVFKDRHNIETRQVSIYRDLGNVTYISRGITEGETVITKNGLLVYDAIND
ncbi:MAG TPA: efflux RND transporter periplasmic adaptor subunit [Cyclobacteriaceae bacterium]|nr:efflux RND transporter periplasmic adaptor subunit [Cyclobacteriaceae bacterium]